MLSWESEFAWYHLNSAHCFPSDSLPLLNLFTSLRLVAGRCDVLLRRQGCSVCQAGIWVCAALGLITTTAFYRFNKWLMSLSDHLRKRLSSVLINHFNK